MGQLSSWKQEFELVLTDPENQVFDIKKLRFTDRYPENLTYYITVDGAFSERETADFSAISVLGVDEHDNWFISSYAMRANPMTVADKVMELVANYGVDFVGIEKGAWKLAVGNYIEEQMKNYQVWFTINDLNTAGSKLSRMKALASVINTGRMTIVDLPDAQSETLVEQIELLTHEGISGHDDQLDSASQLLQMETYWYPQGGIGSYTTKMPSRGSSYN
jgi:phage terminase large subunit-like protein